MNIQTHPSIRAKRAQWPISVDKTPEERRAIFIKRRVAAMERAARRAGRALARSVVFGGASATSISKWAVEQRRSPQEVAFRLQEVVLLEAILVRRFGVARALVPFAMRVMHATVRGMQ